MDGDEARPKGRREQCSLYRTYRPPSRDSLRAIQSAARVGKGIHNSEGLEDRGGMTNVGSSRRKEALIECGVRNAECGMSRFMAPMCVRNSEVRALHEPPHLVAADVRRLTLIQRVRSGKRSEPRYLGSYVRLAWVQGPNARPKFGGPASP